MNFYPYSSPIILTDALFVLYGGDGTLGTSKQRELAYWLSEKTVSQNLKTFLLPTTITGTFASPRATILLDHAYINSVSTVRFIDTEEKIYFTATGSNSSYFSLRDDVYGIVDLHCIVASCSVCSSNGVMIYPYQVQIVYNAGLSSGTTYQPNMLLALTTYSTIILNEIIGYGNEAPGDVGVERYSSQQYSETRRIMNTDFGNSPKAIFVNRLLREFRKHKFVGL